PGRRFASAATGGQRRYRPGCYHWRSRRHDHRSGCCHHSRRGCAAPAGGRPVSVWDAVVGQTVVPTLRPAAVDGGRSAAMTHAWLIVGPPGSGRSVVARAFAATLQCQRAGCGECSSCVTTLAGTHPDVTLVVTEQL